MKKKTSFIKKLFLSLILLYVVIFVSLFVFQSRVFRSLYTRRVINTTIDEIDNTFNALSLTGIDAALVEFSQSTQTSSLIVPAEQLKQDISVLNYLTIEIEADGLFYDVYVPNNRFLRDSIGKEIITTVYQHIPTGNYIPSSLTINSRTILNNPNGQLSALFTKLIPDTDESSKITITGTVSEVRDTVVVDTTVLNPIASGEILTIITENYTDEVVFDNGFYYSTTSPDEEYSNLVFYSEEEIDGKSVILVAVYPLSHIDDIVQAVRLVNLYTFIVVFVVLVGASLIYSNSFNKPLKKINDSTKSLANLDFSNKNIVLDRNDEFGELSENINLLSNNLEQTLTTLTAQNKQLSSSIQRENENEFSRRNFVRGLSHEIKTPLAVIQASSEAIQNNIFDNEDDKYKALTSIQNEVKRTSDIVNSMMQVYKIDSPNYKNSWEKTELSTILQKLELSLSPLLKSKELKISKSIKETYINGDIEKISLVFSNLYSNAIKHCLPSSSIIINLDNIDEYVVFSIKNKANYISEKDLEHLFDPFYKVDKSGTRSENNTGLGLYIVQQILKQYHSKCTVAYVDEHMIFSFKIKSSY